MLRIAAATTSKQTSLPNSTFLHSTVYDTRHWSLQARLVGTITYSQFSWFVHPQVQNENYFTLHQPPLLGNADYFRQLDYGKMEHVGPLVQSLVGLVTEFLREHCSQQEENGKESEAKKNLTEVCDQLRLTAAKQPPNKEQLTSEITELGSKFTQIVDNILIQHISVSNAIWYQQVTAHSKSKYLYIKCECYRLVIHSYLLQHSANYKVCDSEHNSLNKALFFPHMMSVFLYMFISLFKNTR